MSHSTDVLSLSTAVEGASGVDSDTLYTPSASYGRSHGLLPLDLTRGARLLVHTPCDTVEPASLAARHTGSASSFDSEQLSLAVVLSLLPGARLLCTEMAVRYDTSRPGAITDYVVALANDSRLGVSVTRACNYINLRTPLSISAAERLLKKKLRGVQTAQQRCVAPRWSAQLLHVWCYCDATADAMRSAFHHIPPALLGSTIVLCSVASHSNRFIF